jgi:hypothetical protein
MSRSDVVEQRWLTDCETDLCSHYVRVVCGRADSVAAFFGTREPVD